MNKTQLVERIADQTGESKATSAKVLEAALEVISKTVAAGETVTLIGFGGFSVSKRKGRTGRNPRTREEITIAASALPKFTAGAHFKGLVNDAHKQ